MRGSWSEKLSRDSLGVVMVLTLLALITFTPGFFSIPQIDREEARFAQATKQLLESDDLIGNQLQDQTSALSPPGAYWMQAASASNLGGAEAPIWAFRIPSLIGAILAVLLSYWATIPLFGRRAAFIAAMMMSSCLFLSLEARLATSDAVLLACATAAFGAFARIHMKRTVGFFPPFVLWTAIGLGVLVKGLILLGPLIGAMIWMSFKKGRTGFLSRLRVIPGLLWALVLCVPWFLTIWLQTDGMPFGDGLGEKRLAGIDRYWAPPGVHLASFFLTFWPWTILFFLALPFAWDKRQSHAFRLLFGWIIPFWVVLEIVPIKLPHSSLVLFPAIAILTACVVRSTLLELEDPVRGWKFWVPLILWLIPAIGIPAAAIAGPYFIEGAFEPVAVVFGALALICLIVCLRTLMRWRLWPFVKFATAAAVLSYVALFFGAVPAIKTQFIALQIDATLELRDPLEKVALVDSVTGRR